MVRLVVKRFWERRAEPGRAELRDARRRENEFSIARYGAVCGIEPADRRVRGARYLILFASSRIVCGPKPA
jgi:hypothetical protein